MEGPKLVIDLIHHWRAFQSDQAGRGAMIPLSMCQFMCEDCNQHGRGRIGFNKGVQQNHGRFLNSLNPWRGEPDLHQWFDRLWSMGFKRINNHKESTATKLPTDGSSSQRTITTFDDPQWNMNVANDGLCLSMEWLPKRSEIRNMPVSWNWGLHSLKSRGGLRLSHLKISASLISKTGVQVYFGC